MLKRAENSKTSHYGPEKTEKSNNSVFSGHHQAISEKKGSASEPSLSDFANAIIDLPTTAEEVLNNQIITAIDLEDIDSGHLPLVNVRLLVASWILADKQSLFNLNHDYPRLLGVSKHPPANVTQSHKKKQED